MKGITYTILFRGTLDHEQQILSQFGQTGCPQLQCIGGTLGGYLNVPDMWPCIYCVGICREQPGTTHNPTLARLCFSGKIG